MENRAWYRILEDREIGPLDFERLKALANAGNLEPDDLVREEGQDVLFPAYKIEGLFATKPKEELLPGVASPKRPWLDFKLSVTWIALLCAAVYFVMFSWLQPDLRNGPSAEQLADFGASQGPLTFGASQYWRIFTHLFVHNDPVHLFSNALVLIAFGNLVEGLFGIKRFLILYALSGIGGCLLQTAWSPQAVSVGASGAIFGVLGGLIAFLNLNGRAYTRDVVQKNLTFVMLFLAYNAYGGFMHKGTGLAAHAGGLATGYLAGLVLAPMERKLLPGLTREIAGVSVILMLFGASIYGLQHKTQGLDIYAITQKVKTLKAYLEKIQPILNRQEQIEASVLHEAVALIENSNDKKAILKLEAESKELQAKQEANTPEDPDLKRLHRHIVKEAQRVVDMTSSIAQIGDDPLKGGVITEFLQSKVNRNAPLDDFHRDLSAYLYSLGLEPPESRRRSSSRF